MTNLRVWIGQHEVSWLTNEQSLAYTRCIDVYSFPLLTTDICYELVPVSREVLEREAAEGIKQIDEEKK